MRLADTRASTVLVITRGNIVNGNYYHSTIDTHVDGMVWYGNSSDYMIVRGSTCKISKRAKLVNALEAVKSLSVSV
jgi:hypothetical protein